VTHILQYGDCCSNVVKKYLSAYEDASKVL
jgi:hypothetical protein